MTERRDYDRVIPILGSRDLSATAAFYDKLGFAEQGRWPSYLILVRDWIELHFFLDPTLDPLTNASGCYVRSRDAVALYEVFASSGIAPEGTPRLTPPRRTDYGMTEFALVDLDGNLLRIGRAD